MRYVCRICGHVYDEDKEKVPFDQLPDTWKCPLCGASKQDFQPETEKKSAAPKPAAATADAGMKALSAGQLSALCSNLARGCEKQYKPEEAKLFKELADYFAAVTPPVNDASVEKIADLLHDDADNYAQVRESADSNGDRGAARVCVWGEKVTRMLSSLVTRYLKEGEAMLAGANVWVCTVCGFVYVGDKAPELCPVCKVPEWKFEKIEGRA
ncbi:MAG: rubredoxin [Clostridia bacterium]|nr:rubredoxin [Clostridia bacterium]